ncbi:MAG: DUF4474 domain-containing protein [Oscillospiraceae bacterium]|nr:DUF4474 domain-containing protein [Oscillospiraceae bacterium]
MILSMLSMILSTLLSLLTAFSGMGARAEAPGVPVWDQTYYEANYKPVRLAPRFEVIFDEPLLQAFDGLKEETGFDIVGVVNSFPDIYHFHRWMVRAFPGFFYDWADNWLAKGNSYEGIDGSRMVLYRLVGTAAAMPVRARFTADPIDWSPNSYAIRLELGYEDGSVRDFPTYSVYNAETGEFGEENGVSGLGYNFIFGDKNYAYTTLNPFQRGLGYMKLYDDLLLQTNKSVNVETVRLKFPYEGKDWMLQLWKGRYFITTGAEIGIYNKPPSRLVEFYNAVTDEERVEMSFKLTVNDNGAQNVLIDRPLTLQWWMTGFAVRRYLYTPDKLTLETEIVPTDEAMKDALIASLKKEEAKGSLTYTESAEGTLLIVW